MKNKIYKLASILMMLWMGFGCSEALDPLQRGWIDDDEVWENIIYTHGVLDLVYNIIGSDWQNKMGFESEYYTDNLVLNSSVSSYALGGQSSTSYIGEWGSAYYNILHINFYLENGLDVHWTGNDDEVDSIAKARYFGEAHFLRAWNEALLLKQYAGPTEVGGSMMGFPIVHSVLENEEYSNLPRNTYDECLASILSDLDTAYQYLPYTHRGAGGVYDGAIKTGRATGQAVLALKVRVLLYAASAAYNTSNDNSKWIAAAVAAHEAIQADGGLQVLQAYGEFNNTDNPDDYWRTTFVTSSSLESSNFPPSRYGNGYSNPSQNLIDAFPMENGLDVTDANSGYDPKNPYDGRDKRFYNFIAYNGDPMFGNQNPVETFVGGVDYSGVLKNNATRTGFYMKRFLSNIVVGNDPRKLDGVVDETQKFAVLLDREELYLNFAEAANEIAGSDPNVALAAHQIDISAMDALLQVRQRGMASGNDSVLIEKITDQASFRNLVRNERRIELCFRGHRYWDVRRWKLPLDEINAPVMGVEIEKINDSTFTYSEIEVEPRAYSENTYYGPLPYDEIAKSESLVQNLGW